MYSKRRQKNCVVAMLLAQKYYMAVYYSNFTPLSSFVITPIAGICYGIY